MQIFQSSHPKCILTAFASTELILYGNNRWLNMSRKTMMAEGNCSSAHHSSSSFSSMETTHFCGSLFNAWLRKWTLFLACSSLEMFGGSSLVVNSASYQSLPVHLNFYSDFTLSSWSTNPFYCAALIAPSTIVFSGNGCKWCQTIHNPLFLS